MAGIENMNVTLNQSNLIKEVHHTRRQMDVSQQQLVVQDARQKKRVDKAKVERSESGQGVAARQDEDRDQKQDRRDPPTDLDRHLQAAGRAAAAADEQEAAEAGILPEGSIIDIKV